MFKLKYENNSNVQDENINKSVSTLENTKISGASNKKTKSNVLITKSKKPHKKHKKISIKEISMVLIPSLILLIVVSMVFYITKKADSYKIKDEVVQYYAGQEFKIPLGSTLIRKEGNAFLVKNGNDEYDLQPMPIYYKNKEKFVLPSNMIFFEPRENIMKRVNGLSEIYYDNNNLVISYNGKNKNLKPGFLFDGYNVYIFLEPMTLKYDGYKIELSAFSYIEANNSSEIMVYNHNGHKMFTDQPKTPVTVTSNHDDYTISLLNDSLTMGDGTKILLFNRPDGLDSYFK